MTWGKKYYVKDRDELYDVMCPNETCRNTFKTARKSLYTEFVCNKCGTEWYGGLKDEQQTKDGEC